jgi:hypothetical protein
LQHCNENSTYVFQEKELRGLNPVCEEFIYPRIGPHIFLQQDRQTWNIFAGNPLAELTELPE